MLVRRIARVIARLVGEPNAVRVGRVYRRLVREPYERLVSKAGLDDDVSHSLTRPLTPSEREAIERLDVMRAACEADAREIVIVEHGAGSPSARRTSEQMEHGIPTTQRVGEVCRKWSKSKVWGEFLFRLVRYACPKACVELGTCVGVSSSYIASALELNGRGRLVTLEGSSSLAEVARANLASVGLTTVDIRVGTFAATLGGVLEEMHQVDFVFIDGHHDGQATVRYFEQVRPYLSDTNVVIFDDIDWSKGMREAWRTIAESAPSHALGNVGLCLNVTPGSTPPS